MANVIRKIESPDGRVHDFSVPEGAPDSVVQAMFAKQWKPIGQQYPQGEAAYRQQIQQMDAQNQRRFTGQEGPTDEPMPFFAGMGGAMKRPYNWAKHGGLFKIAVQGNKGWGD